MNDRRASFSFLVALVIAFIGQASEAGTIFKFATLAPKGSSWDKIMVEYNNAVKTQTGGAVEFSIYAGGVMGDEPVIEQKMRLGQIDAAGFTGMGLGKIAPAVRVMECPMLLDSYEKVDRAFAAVGPELEGILRQKGYVLLGWAHPGMVNPISKKQIISHETLKGAKIWIWAGDFIAEGMCKTLGCNSHPLGLPDVLTSLQTGLIDTVYCPGLGCLALQWYTKTKYLTDINLVHSMGATVIRQASLAKLSPAHQQIVKDLGRKYMQQLTTQTRAENRQSIQAMQSSGIQIVKPSAADEADLRTKSLAVCDSLAGTVFPADLVARVKGAIQ